MFERENHWVGVVICAELKSLQPKDKWVEKSAKVQNPINRAVEWSFAGAFDIAKIGRSLSWNPNENAHRFFAKHPNHPHSK